MSSTDNALEKKKIKEQADSMKGMDIIGPAGVVSEIREYAFETPVEFRNQLNQLWKDMGKEYMSPFAQTVTVATFKSRSSKREFESISPFIYEF